MLMILSLQNKEEIMKVTCIYNSIDENNNFYFEKSDSTNGHNYPFLEQGKQYYVMGIIFGTDGLSFLIDSGGFIEDCPYQLFKIDDNIIPPFWKIGLFNHSKYYQGIISICGYEELIEDEKHYLDLFEHNKNAILIYFKRKINLEKYYEGLEYLK